MKMNRIRLSSFALLLIVLVFGIGACAPSAAVPAPALSFTPTPSHTATPIPPGACDVNKVDITDVRWFQEPDGAWRVVGMMHNNSGKPISKLTMGVLTKNKNDELVYPDGPKGESISAYPLNLLPGNQAPFSAWIKREIPTLDHFTIEKKLCIVAEPAERLQLQEHGGQLLVDDAGLAHVTVEVFNPGSQTALINGMMVAVFDASDNLLSAVDANVTPRILPPGEKGPVRATLALPPGEAVNVKTYKLYMDPLVTEPPAAFVNAQTDIEVNAQYFDTAGHFHLVGQITNVGTKPMMISVQATMYADQDKTTVMDAAFMNTLIPLAAGEDMPFDLMDWQVLNNKADLQKAFSQKDIIVMLRVEPFHTWTMDASVATLKVVEGSSAFSANQAVFTGQVENDTDRNIILGTVTVTLRDKASGKIIATGQAPLEIVNALVAGETLNYSIAIPVELGFNPETVEFEITASGQQT